MKAIEQNLYPASIVALVLVCWTVVSCGNDGPTEPEPQTPTSITLSPVAATLTAVGETLQLTATLLDQEGKIIADAGVSWTSTNASVVKVDANGLVIAVQNGYVQITAASGGVNATVSIIVAQASSRIEILPGVPYAQCAW